MKLDISKEWCMNMAKREDGEEIGAGILAVDPMMAVPSTDLSADHADARRIMRMMFLEHDVPQEIMDQYYDTITLAEHEAARRALENSSVSATPEKEN